MIDSLGSKLRVAEGGKDDNGMYRMKNGTVLQKGSR